MQKTITGKRFLLLQLQASLLLSYIGIAIQQLTILKKPLKNPLFISEKMVCGGWGARRMAFKWPGPLKMVIFQFMCKYSWTAALFVKKNVSNWVWERLEQSSGKPGKWTIRRTLSCEMLKKTLLEWGYQSLCRNNLCSFAVYILLFIFIPDGDSSVLACEL